MHEGTSFDQNSADLLCRNALVQAITTILDSPLAFAQNNDNDAQASAELHEGLGLAEAVPDPHAWNNVFQQVPLTGANRDDIGVPEALGMTPKPYQPGKHRIHVYEVDGEVRPTAPDGGGATDSDRDTCTLTVRAHSERETYAVQLFDVPLEQASRRALELAAGMRLSGE